MKILGLLLLAAFVRSEPPNLCGSDVCHRYASCVGGGCVCDDGYTGDGKTCIGVNICAQGNDCHSDATCTYTGPGTYQCTCNEGFDGDGKSCSESGPGPAICKKTDIIFVLDRSSSIRPADYNLMRSFISSLAQKLKIGKRDKDGEIIGQGAIVTFSEVGTKRINLKESQVEGSFLEMVKAMPGPLPGGRTKTHRGLKVADEVVLTKSAGFREDDDDVARIFMVITDGKQTRESKRKGYIYVGEAMKPFFARDMNVFAVGVGLKDNSAKQQIRDMVEDPNNAILAENFMELTETVNNFIQRFCKVPSICGNADDCSSEASCADTAPGEYECTCPTGYNGNGKFCLVPPVCGSARDDCDPFFATCTDKGAGEYECKCVPGYTGDGRTCIPDKICDTPKDDCHEYATCTDLAPGEYKCECNLGYSGDGRSCIAISIGFETLSYNVREEDSRAIVEVSVKTGEITTPLTFNFNTQFGTAGASDFTEKSQRITFQPGQSGPIAVEIEIEDDTQIESTEAFQVTISDPSYTVGMGGPATVNILDNDEAVIGFTSSVVDVREDQTAVMEIGFTSGSASSPVTVRLATNAGTASDVDFVGKTVDVTFEAGETGPKRVQFEIVDDSMVESTEAFTVSLVSSSLSAVKVGEPSTVNILDNDEATIGFSKASYDVAEGVGKARVKVAFTAGEALVPVTVGFATTTGTAGEGDFVSKTTDVTFQPGETEKWIEIDITDDDLLEPTESFGVSLVSSSVDAVKLGGPSTVNILDNDEATIGFSEASYNVVEGAGKARVKVAFTAGESLVPVTVGFATTTGTAGEGDFVSKTTDVTFQPGEKEKWIEIDITDDDLLEPTESFGVSLVSSSVDAVKLGGPSTVNILDNDEATIGFSEASYDVVEGVGKARVWVGFTAGEALVPVTVGFATTTGTAGEGDFVSKTTDVTFQPGEKGKWIEIDITDDDLLEPTESFGVSLVSSSVEDVKLGSPSTVNILDNDVATIGFIRQTYDVPEDQKAKIAIGFLRGEATSPVTVRLATRAGTASSEDFVSKEVDVTFQPGETGPKEIEFDLVDDLLVEATESFNIEVVSSSNKVIELGRPSTVNILDNDEAVIGFASSTYDINEDGKAVVEVAFTSGQANVPVTVQLKTSPGTASNEDFVPKTVDVTFQPGETGPKQVEFEIVDDLLVENTESFQVSVVSSSVPAVKSGGPATVNIRDNDEAIVSFIEGSYDVREDENAVIEVEISSGTLTSPVTVRLTTEPLTAGKDDYVPQTVDITFEAGETGPKMMTIPIIDDNLVEPTEKFKVNLVSSSEPSVKLGEPTSVNILLKDNDDAVIGFSKRAYDVIESENARIEVGFSSGESSEPVTVTLETVPSTASANDDYVPQRVNVTLQPGERMKTVEFDIVDDTLLENTEEFKVAVVYSSVPAVTWGKPASVNIQDNDEVVVGFTRLQYDANENEKATVEVQIAAGQSAVPVTVWLQTSPGTAGSGDYSSDPVEITFQPGETGPKSIDIDLVDDEILEDTERFTVFLRPTTPRVKAGRPASVQILDNEVPPICNTPRDDCHRYATCTDDGPGEYSCKCNEGYTGDGKSCLAINVCGTDQDDCHGDATCVNTGPGTFMCSCNEGFTGDGRTCEKLPAPAPACKKMDIMFVLDRSGSINPDDFEHMRHFLLRIAELLKIGKRDEDGEVIGQGAIVTFSEEGTLRVTLKESQTEGKFVSVVNSMPGPKTGGRTKTHRGLTVANEQVVTPEAGLRMNDAGVEKIFMVITDGKQTKESVKKGYEYVGKAMQVFHNRGYLKVFAVGVGLDDQDARNEVRDMVQFPENAILTENYKELIDTVENIVMKFCPVPPICGSENDDCDKNLASCENTQTGSYNCTCNQGYIGNGKKCIAPYVCGTLRDDCHPYLASCTDRENGNYVCECIEHYIGNGKTCQATKICGTEREDCHEHATCFDTGPASYKCRCNKGYVGDGKMCEVEKICGTPKDDCHEYATCADIAPGEYKCTCKPGYTGNGKTCTVIKICGTPQDDCSEFATCTDTEPGKFTCTCNQGYTGDGKTCTAIKLCGTARDDCSEFATCTDTDPGEFTCDCNPGYSGDGRTCKGVTFKFTKPRYTSGEGVATLPEIVVSAGDITAPVTLRVTASPGTAGEGDFTPKTIDVTFAPGEKGPKSIPISIIDDDVVEPTEEFTVSMSSSSPGVTVGGPATVVIEDNDKPGVTFKFTKPTYTSGEGVQALPEIVVSAGDITAPTTVRVTASPGTAGEGDFTPKTIDVTFAPGEKGPKSIPINIIDDDVVEPTEEFTVSMSSSSPGVTVGGPATVVIEDNDKPAPCKPKTDLIFVLDRSGSIRKEDYDMMREFVNKIAKELKVGERNEKGEIIGQAAIVTFSEKGEKRITLAQSQDKDKFYDIVARMPGPLLGGRTKTHRALAIADKELAIKEAGYREDDPEVKKMIMVITDGEQTKESVSKGYIYVGEAMKPFFARNMDVFAIGVGLDNQGAIDEVRDMVEVPENAILASNFTDLVHRVESIIKKFCPDLKICGTPQDDCSQFATCADTEPGEYSCTCNQGYTGDGKTCTPIKICGTPQDDCSQFATCADTQPGEYSCTCNQGYTGDGRYCAAIKLCGTARDDCSEFATCTDTDPGEFTCDCNPGYSGDGRTCKGVTFKFTKPRYTSGEGVATLPEIVVSAGDITAPVTLRVTASPGTAGEGDFSPKTIDVTFAPGEKGPKSIPINIIDDDVVEPTEEFTVSMSSSSPGVTVGGPATVVIEDNDKPGVTFKFTKPTYTSGEGVQALPEIVVSAGEITAPTTVRVTASPGTAGEGDFTPKTIDVTFAPGEKGPKSIPINIIDDDVVEPTEEFTISMSSSSPGVTVGGPATVVIEDNDKPAPCKPKTDLIFVLDRSGSIRKEDYDMMREFVNKIAKELKVGERNEKGEIIGQAAIVTFSEKGEKRITLAQSQDKDKFYDIVARMPGPLLGGRTKTHRALAIADKELAIKEAGYREDDPEVKKMIMVITDGEQTKESVRKGYIYVGEAMKPFFARNMDVFAIGVGLENQAAIDEVRDMVEVPENAILASNFTDLVHRVESIIKKFCPDLKICGTPQDDCSQFATCADTQPGEYSCTCNQGYTGDGKTCTPIKICGTPQDDCSQFATCADTQPGEYSCTCNQGYTGDGKTCTAIKICGTPQDDCSQFATCADTQPGEYSCTCNQGYTGDGRYCAAIKLCGTARDDCSEFATCTDTDPGEFTCDCNPGYSGDGRTCKGVTFKFTKPRYTSGESVATLPEIVVSAGDITAPVTLSVTASPGTAGEGDFSPKTIDVTFAPGEKGPKSIPINIIDDDVVEPTEEFTVSMSSSSPGVTVGGPATVVIEDNDKPGVTFKFTKPTYTSGEGVQALPEIVVSAGDITAPTTVRVTASPGTAGEGDFTPKTIDVTFAPGEKGPKSIPINIIDDDVVEPTEEFTVSMSSSSPGVTVGGPATVVIEDNDKPAPCKPKTDLIFVLDRSGSIRKEDYDMMREFVNKIAKELKVGERNEKGEIIGQAAIVTFSEKGEKRITLAQSQDKDQFYDIVARMPGPLLGGRTKTHRALAIADKELAIKEAGYREDDPEVKKMIMVITDGEQTKESVSKGYIYVGEAMKPFFARNMDVFAIGVGLDNQGAIDEVRDMVEVPENAILASNFTDLVHRIESIIKKFCPDLKICGTPQDDCSQFATCADTEPGEYSCTCNQGYTGDGKTCTRSYLCGTPQDDCSEFATCADTQPGEYSCTCNQGYSGDGRTCKGVTFKFTKPRYTSGEAVPTLPEIVVSAGDITAPVTLSVTASPGTAGEGDFSPKMIDVTFAPGEKGPKLIPIGIIDDDVVEPTEEFTVSMSSSSPGVTVGEPATVVIEDNDKIPAPVLFDLTPESPTTISAAWRPPPELENVVDYSVCYTDLSNGEEKCKTVKPTTPDGPVHFEFTDMNEDTTYQVSVRARDVAGVLGPVSNIMNVKTPATDPVDACDKKTDTIFVVDRSSISESGYDNIRSFILNVARRLRVGVKNERKEIIGQGAVVTFSDEGKKIVTLKDSKYPGRFVKAVRSMPGPLSDATRAGKIHRGLEIAYREVAVANEGLRVRDDSVHKTVVVITNGHQTEEKNGYVYVGDAVKPFFKRGIDVIAIGIDLETGKAKDQLKDMVRIPQNAFLVNHHSNLSSAMNRIVSQVCPKTKICGSPRDDCHRFATCFDTAPGEYKCICRDGYIGDGKECAEKTCNLDIGFLIDSSASMRDCNYEKEKKLVKHIAEQMLVGTNKSRASIVLFSDTAAMYKKFNAVEELKEFNMLVNELPMVGGATHLDKALELAASQMFTTANGMRDNTVPKLLFVLTDGAQSAISMSKPLQEIASSLHERNIRVIVIGAGEADEQQLSPLVQANADLLMVKRFEDATDALTLFAENMCSVGRCSHMEMVVPVRIDGCVSPHPVKIGTCMGKCVTGPNFRLADGIFKMDCQTCRPKGFALKEVTLTCPGNRKRRFEIREATSCMCEKCPWKKRLL